MNYNRKFKVVMVAGCCIIIMFIISVCVDYCNRIDTIQYVSVISGRVYKVSPLENILIYVLLVLWSYLKVVFLSFCFTCIKRKVKRVS